MLSHPQFYRLVERIGHKEADMMYSLGKGFPCFAASKERTMSASAIMRWTLCRFKGIRRSQSKTLATLVWGLMRSHRVGIAAIGRALGGIPKHAIKRVDRFLSNPRIDLELAHRALAREVIGPRKRVLVSVDWTQVRAQWVLVAGVVVGGRAAPILWAVCWGGQFRTSQNAFEGAFFLLLKTILPPGVEAVILADRGFHRVELLKRLQELGLEYIIRQPGNVWVRSPGYEGLLRQLQWERGRRRDLRECRLRRSRPVLTRLVALWDRGQAEPWYLATNCADPAGWIAKAYGKRFTVDQAFRDTKSTRFGWSLGQLKIQRAERLERLLLVMAVAYWLLTLLGVAAEQAGWDRKVRANTVKTRTHSWFTLGKICFHQRLLLPLAAAKRSVQSMAPIGKTGDH